MPLIETKGAASAQGFGEFAKTGIATYIEDVFSTYLYTGNGSTQTITNGIDLSTKGGLVWLKGRSSPYSNCLTDTVQGRSKQLSSNNTNAANTAASNDGITSFNADGFSLGGANTFYNTNVNNVTFASWTFRKQPKFFDVVTYTGNGSSITVNHNLGSVPGMIIIKNTTNADSWLVWHRSLSGTSPRIYLDETTAAATTLGIQSSSVSSTSFTYPWSYSTGNASGNTYVAYLFAHNAGGFGTAGTDNVISCGSYTGTGALLDINLGYEPQWIMVKNASASSNWVIIDNMRGFPAYSTIGGATLFPNTSDAENSGAAERFGPTATGFQVWGNATLNNASGNTYIYIAIRRGPMKVPTSASTVFSASTRTGNGLSYTVTTSNFAPDVYLAGDLQATTNGGLGQTTTQRLIGTTTYLLTNSTAAAGTNSFWTTIDWGIRSITSQAGLSTSGYPYVDYLFGRAPSFMDVVCWYGDPATVNHNLTVVPELIIQKNRTTTQGWSAWRPGINYGFLNTTAAFTTYTSGTVTSTTFTPLQTGSGTSNYVAYLFASCPGVSKVGSYSGTGATQTISCGFAARFVMIKRTDSTGDWWVWDTARGMVAGNDTRFALNSTADYLNANWVYTNASGFQIVTTDATVNASGGSYIYLAIA